MRLPKNESFIPRAKELRKNMTKEERHLWYDYLSKHNVHFSRQKLIANYIVDFFCVEARLIIELDGSQHYEKEALEYDNERTEYLESLGFNVLRFSNLDIQNCFEGVCKEINRTIYTTLQSATLTAPLKGSLEEIPILGMPKGKR